MHFTPDGIRHQAVPCGQGVIDWVVVLSLLVAQAPRVHLSVENPQPRYEMPLRVFNHEWLVAHRDLTAGEYARIIQPTRQYEAEIDRADAIDPDKLTPSDQAEQIDHINSSARFLRKVLAEVASRTDTGR